jgi:hypothetical protein
MTIVAGRPTCGASVIVFGYHQSWTSPELGSVWMAYERWRFIDMTV